MIGSSKKNVCPNEELMSSYAHTLPELDNDPVCCGSPTNNNRGETVGGVSATDHPKKKLVVLVGESNICLIGKTVPIFWKTSILPLPESNCGAPTAKNVSPKLTE